MFFMGEGEKKTEKKKSGGGGRLHVQEKDFTDLPDYGKPVEMP